AIIITIEEIKQELSDVMKEYNKVKEKLRKEKRRKGLTPCGEKKYKKNLKEKELQKEFTDKGIAEYQYDGILEQEKIKNQKDE
ncbi:12898_t:CDS:2, partial [Funneliformis geosporum]